MKKALTTVLAACLPLMSTLPAAAQAPWPSQPIKIIVSYSAGGAGDQIARIVSEQLTIDLKTPVIVDNRPGASGMIGGAACKAAKPDGYTYCVFLGDVVTSNPVLFKSVPYDAQKDFVPVSFLADINTLLIVPEKSGIKSIQDLVQQAKSHPSSTNWGSWGVGSSAHLVLSVVEKAYDTPIAHVPYKNTPDLINAVFTGEISGTISAYSLVHGHLEQKTMRAIAAMGEKRLPFMPDVPTFAEQGVPLTATLWYGLFAPAATPAQQVTAMNAAVNRAIHTAVEQKKLDQKWFMPRTLTQPEFATVVKKETAVWGEIARQSGIRLD
ncbi:MAG: tripartite tricarboxylate transporter substrate binding protein [Burkholderiaceae bacterium]